MKPNEDRDIEELLRELESLKDASGKRRPIKRSSRIGFGLLAIAIASGLVAATILFMQTNPGPTTVGSVLTGLCATTAPLPSSGIPAASAGFVTWACGASTPAFTVNAGGGTVTPSFGLGTGFTTLFIYRMGAVAGTSCSVFTMSPKQLTSGTSVVFLPGDAGSWDYCSDYTSAPSGSFGSTTITWHQP
jgi:hypothetical protein